MEVLAAAAHPFSDAPELSEEQREVLSKLEEEIDAALEKFGDAGAFIKLDTCSGKDSVLDRNDADHIQEIKVHKQACIVFVYEFLVTYCLALLVTRRC